jgi:phospho-N-acetylmuramoyl-pentapeptide-transferase
MGGGIILFGMLLPALFYRPPSGSVAELRAVLLCTLGFGVIGFLDDYLIVKRGRNLGLRAREKLLGQFIVGGGFAAWYYFFGASRALPAPDGSFQWWPVVMAVYHVLLLVGMSNAVNLTDGLDGLAAGVSLPVWAFLALAGALVPLASGGGGNPAVVLFCAAFAGATLGYLWYNAHPAQVFMGDTGSLAIGGGVAAAAVALHQEWLILLAAGVHVVEAASVMLQVISFKSTGKRIFKMSPLHHHFELCEWPETRIVGRFAVASALCAAVALSLLFWRM